MLKQSELVFYNYKKTLHYDKIITLYTKKPLNSKYDGREEIFTSVQIYHYDLLH